MIRIVAVGCRVSEYLKETTLIRAGHNLPNFSFWLRALGTAVQDDPFWGPEFWRDIGNRAFGVEMGVRELISQCLELRDVDVQPIRHPQEKALHVSESVEVVGMPRSPCRERGHQPGAIALKPSPFARRQARLKYEEQEWLSKALVACWASLWLDEQNKKNNKKAAINVLKRPRLSFPSARMRSVTY